VFVGHRCGLRTRLAIDSDYKDTGDSCIIRIKTWVGHALVIRNYGSAPIKEKHFIFPYAK